MFTGGTADPLFIFSVTSLGYERDRSSELEDPFDSSTSSLSPSGRKQCLVRRVLCPTERDLESGSSENRVERRDRGETIEP